MKYFDNNILRLFDANVNRAQEGIRVIEDTARMLLDNEALTLSIKDIRHSLRKIVNSEKDFSFSLIKARGSESDVLRDGLTHSERTREDVNAIVLANFGRTQEALRSLEEYSKLLYPLMSEQFKAIRFRLYDVQKSLILALQSHVRMELEKLRIFVVIDLEMFPETDLSEYVGAMIDEGAGTIACRDMQSSDGTFVDRAGIVCEVCRSKNVTTIIYDRLDCAMILGSDGIHIDQSGLSLNLCRQVAGYNFFLGYSITIEDNNDPTSRIDADYILINTRENKPGDILSELTGYVSNSSIPVLVQGIFQIEDRVNLLESGVTGFVLIPQYQKPGGILETIRSYSGIIQEYLTKKNR